MNAADLPAAYQNQVAAQPRAPKRPAILDEPAPVVVEEPMSSPAERAESLTSAITEPPLARAALSMTLARSILGLFAAPHHVAGTEAQRERVTFEAAAHIQRMIDRARRETPGGSPLV